MAALAFKEFPLFSDSIEDNDHQGHNHNKRTPERRVVDSMGMPFVDCHRIHQGKTSINANVNYNIRYKPAFGNMKYIF
jgi:hypothetical protein